MRNRVVDGRNAIRNNLAVFLTLVVNEEKIEFLHRNSAL